MESKILQKHSCTTCARRKVKCDRVAAGCSNCFKAQIECIYQAPPVSKRHRRRFADEDLRAKITEYESLLRKNYVDFKPLDDASNWLPSPLEADLRKPPQEDNKQPTGSKQTPIPTGKKQQEDSSDNKHCLWLTLSPDLQNPSLSKLAPFSRFGRPEAMGYADLSKPASPGSGSLVPYTAWPAAGFLELHPEPRKILALWQIFTDQVNPVTKVIHLPTLQPAISEACWNLEAVSRPMEALMFSIYAHAVSSISDSECRFRFQESRTALLSRYREATSRALVAADLYTTRDLMVLQALTLLLLLDQESETTSTLSAVAVRIAHKMGLHRMSMYASLPFFEQEMRIRVWWQLYGIEARAQKYCSGHFGGPGATPFADFGDVRLPLNVNDSELHPEMTQPPVEHAGATEMMGCLLKFDIAEWIRTSKGLRMDTMWTKLSGDVPLEVRTLRQNAIADLRERLYNKHLRYADKSIPLHALAVNMAELALCRMHMWVADPRQASLHPQPGSLMAEGDPAAFQMPQSEIDTCFENSMHMFRLACNTRRIPFAQHMFDHILPRTQLDGFIFMVSELRERVNGDAVDLAWKYAAEFYTEYPVLLEDKNNEFLGKINELVLEAWEARRRELVDVQRARSDDVTPDFITKLEIRYGRVGVATTGMETTQEGLMEADVLVGTDPMISGAGGQQWEGPTVWWLDDLFQL